MNLQENWHKIPVWEILVFALAAFVIFIVFILWFLFGYDLEVVAHRGPSMQAASLVLALL